MQNNFKLTIGFIIYGDNAVNYLSHFLPSIFSQEYTNFSVLAVNNSGNKQNLAVKYIEEYYPQIKILHSEVNLGFARAFNIMFNMAREDGSEYFLALNPDTILEKNVIKILLEKIEGNQELGSVSPKLLKWDFENGKKTKQIDSCGIILKPGLKFIDLGQAEEDQDRYDNKFILGPSGAAALYRMSALQKVKFDNQFFDELMFMYKEDCDLAYRLNLAGFKSICVGDAIVYHDRTVFGKGYSNFKVAMNRKNKSKKTKQWSFLNQQIIFYKYWKIQDWNNKILIIWQEIKMLVFILIFEQYLVGQFVEFFRIREKIKRYTNQ
jgi:GT2 family glycosyltransferase